MTDLDEALVERVARVIAAVYDGEPGWVPVPRDVDAARAVVRLLASEGRLCEPDSDVALLGEEIVHLREDLDNALEALEKALPQLLHYECDLTSDGGPGDPEVTEAVNAVRAVLPKPTG